jgi:GNAT superfamily N-acetyltransferase
VGTAARHPLTIDDTADPVTCLCRFGDGFAPGLGLFGSALHNQLRATVSAERDVQRACEDAPVQRSLDRNLVLDDDASRIDVQAVHDFLANESYWARGRPLEVVQRLVAEAVRVVGLYDDRRQVGFARASTDGTSYVYLADVYVLPEYRGRGLGIELVARWSRMDRSRTFRGFCTRATHTRSTGASASTCPRRA